MLVCSRGRAGGLASACLSAREEGLVVSRVRVCLKGWWSRECVFVCSRGRPGGLASSVSLLANMCLYAREEGLVVSRVRVCMLARTCSRDHQPFLASTRTSCAGMLVTRGRVGGVVSIYECCSLPVLHS